MISQNDVGEILRLESLYQMLLKQNTPLLTFRKQIVHFTNDSISVEVDCPCSPALLSTSQPVGEFTHDFCLLNLPFAK